MSLTYHDGIKTQILTLKNGEVVKGQILSFLDWQFLVRVPRKKGYDRRRLSFEDVESVKIEETK
jgi:hypothetical protein